MNVGYIRVSGEDQNLERQTINLNDAGVTKLFHEKITGSKNKDDRPALANCIEFVRETDVLVVDSIDRLGRSTIDLLNIVKTLTDKGVGFRSLKEPFIDTTSIQGDLILKIFASFAEYERKQSKQRQKEGIAVAKAAGKYKGRQKKQMSNFVATYDLWKENKITATIAAKELGVSRSTFYRNVGDWEVYLGKSMGVN